MLFNATQRPALFKFNAFHILPIPVEKTLVDMQRTALAFQSQASSLVRSSNAAAVDSVGSLGVDWLTVQSQLSAFESEYQAKVWYIISPICVQKSRFIYHIFSAHFVFTYHNQIRRHLFLRQEVMVRSMALNLDALTLAAYLTTWRANAFLIGSESFIWVPRNTPSK